MAGRYIASEYTYCTARVHALENSLIDDAKFARLLEAGTAEEAAQRLSEFGVKMHRSPDGRQDREGTFSEMLEKAFAETERDVPSTEVFAFLRSRYDCSNLKSALKCGIRGVDPMPLMVKCGRIPIAAVIRAADTKDFSELPKILADAAAEAVEAYAKTGNPQVVDMIMDKACFEQMAYDADRSGVAAFRKLVAAESDLINVIMCVRVLRMMGIGDAGRAFLADSLLKTGRIKPEKILGCYDSGEESLRGMLGKTEYADFGGEITADKPLYLLEKLADDFRMKMLDPTKYIIYGAEAPASYVIATETIVKNLRILFAGKDTGLDSYTIRERMRAGYV